MKLILDFIISAVGAEKKETCNTLYLVSHQGTHQSTTSLDGERCDKKRPTTTIKTFSTLGLKPKDKEKEKESKKKDVVAATTMVPSTKKPKSIPFEEGKPKQRREKSLSPIPKERRRSKRRLMKLAEESSFSLKANDKVSAITTNPINMADTATIPITPTTLRAARTAQRGIIIKEPAPKEPTPKEVPKGKGKKKVKGASAAPSRDSTPSPI